MALTQIGTIDVISGGYSTSTISFAVANNTSAPIYIIYSAQRTQQVITSGSRYPSSGTSSNSSYFLVITSWKNADDSNYFIPILWDNPADGSQRVFYMHSDGTYKSERLADSATITIPIFSIPTSGGISSINLSTVDPNTTIEALVDGTMTEINNTPKTVDITDGDVIIDVSTHSPKDKYTVQVNNGDNMLRVVDGSTQYNSFPASIPVETNKTLTAYGEPDREITINYTNTGKPVITNT